MIPAEDHLIKNSTERILHVCRGVIGIAANADAAISTVGARVACRATGVLWMTSFVANPVINPREFVLIADVLTAGVFTDVARGEAEGNVRHTKTTIAAKVSSGIFGAVKVAIALNASTIVITEILVCTVTGVEAWARECLITERFAVPTQSNFTGCGWITLR